MAAFRSKRGTRKVDQSSPGLALVRGKSLDNQVIRDIPKS